MSHKLLTNQLLYQYLDLQLHKNTIFLITLTPRSFDESLKLILLVLKTHQKILGKIFWVRVNESSPIIWL